MKLKGKTRFGKNKIAEAGTNEWRIERASDSVQALGNRPGVLISPIGPIDPYAKARWIHADGDPNFEWDKS